METKIIKVIFGTITGYCNQNGFIADAKGVMPISQTVSKRMLMGASTIENQRIAEPIAEEDTV